MNYRVALFIMTIFVVAVCTSCAARQADPAEPEAPAAPEPPDEEDADLDPFERTVSVVRGDVRVSHEVPTGWSVDLSNADEGQIRMGGPDINGGIVLLITRRQPDVTARQFMGALLSFWMSRAAQDPRVQISQPAREVVEGNEVWGLVCRLNAEPPLNLTIAHIIFISNDPDFMMAGIGTWPTEDHERFSSVLVRIAAGAVVLPRETPEAPPDSI
jgi:hypothetical protein